MSNSFKKTPIWTDNHSPGTRWGKQQANKAVRRYTDDVQNGKWYRKIYFSWNIHDYRFYQTKQQAIHEWRASRWLSNRFSKKAIIRNWEKDYRRK